MSKSSGERRKIYVDYQKGRSKTTCLVHGFGHLSVEWKVLGDFGSKYAKSRPTKDNRHDPANRKKFNI